MKTARAKNCVEKHGLLEWSISNILVAAQTLHSVSLHIFGRRAFLRVLFWVLDLGNYYRGGGKMYIYITVLVTDLQP